MKNRAAKALFALGFVIAAYVLYAHVAALHAAVLRGGAVAWTERFPEPSAFARDFDVEKSDGIDVDARVGSIAVSRSGPSGDGHATFRTKPFHFDGGTARVRFRVAERAAYDVFVGIERGDQPERRIDVVLRNDPEKPSFRVEGTEELRGPMPPVSVLDYVDGSAVVRDTSTWHTMGLRLDPTSQAIEVSVDDVPVASQVVAWSAGVQARIAFGVRDRHADALHVDFAELEWKPQTDRDLEKVPDFDDHFLGVRLDPLRWNAFLDKDWRADGSVAPYETGNGLRLRAVGLSQSAPGTMRPVAVCTLPFTLTPTRVEVDWDAKDLDHADVFVSLANLPATRTVEVALANRGGGERQFVFRGQQDGKFLPEEIDGPKVTADKAHVLLVYDAWFRKLHVEIDDVGVFDHAFGLQRDEFVRACVGDHVSPEGHADVSITRVHVHRAPY